MTDAAPATPSPEMAATQIEAIRGNPEHAYHQPLHRGHEMAKQEMAALYKARFGTAEIEVGAPPEISVPPSVSAAAEDAPLAALPELPEGVTWDEPGLAELRTAAARDGLAEHVDPLLATAAWLVGKPVPSDDERDWQLTQLWGRELERKMADADAVWLRLPQRVRDNLLAHEIDRQPAFLLRLAEIGARVLRDPDHPLGRAQMQAAYARAQAKTTPRAVPVVNRAEVTEDTGGASDE